MQVAESRSPSALNWRKNLFAVTAASFIGFTGFTLVMPFLPLYLQQLGVSDVGEIVLWSGLSLGVTPAVTALMAPLWGRLADRVGRKIMECADGIVRSHLHNAPDHQAEPAGAAGRPSSRRQHGAYPVKQLGSRPAAMP